MGGKATLLDTALAAGLPVPAGFVIPDGIAAPDARWWLTAAQASSLAVRSAFSAEDRPEESLAGWFTTKLHVRNSAFTAAVEEVRASAGRRHGSFRRDVLVMAMVAANHAGVAFSEPETYDDRVNVADGTAELLVAGEEEGNAVMIPRLEPAVPGWQRRLQRLLNDIRLVFGDDPWDVEWADDGETCWLVQIRPVTAPTRRNEAFTIANHAEILPPLPSQLMTSVIAEAGPDLFAWYRRFDATLPANRPFLEVIAGRPFINLSLLEDMLRHLGLPTRLVADSIGGPPEHARPVRLLRLIGKLPVLLRMGMAQVRAVLFARSNEQRLASAGEGTTSSFTDALRELHDAYVGLVTGMFPLSSAIGPPLAILRTAGTLVEHSSRHRTITTELAEQLDEVQMGQDPGALDRFLGRFGHRGVYESDIARPRYADDVTLLGASGAATARPPAVARTAIGALTAPVWWLARPPLAARERLRHEAMVGFATIRSALLRHATNAVADGRLPSVDHLWLLDADEARRLDEGWRPERAFWEERLAERERLAALDPPHVVHRFDDPARWSHHDPGGDLLEGLSLTDGVVSGRAWVLREPSVELPEGFEPATTVLVARSVDAGWIPTVALVAAVVVEIGGDLSHGSILLRERGVPAITNVRGATRTVETGEMLEVRAGAGVVERRSPVRVVER
ncbi:MAG: hypothetical protein HKN26_02370 [Acidimicrobiales bacterium]|nr:hypothetical protein [Acidimicrobiales bacterium]